MVSSLVPGVSGPGSSPGRGHSVVFLGRTLNSHSASLHPGDRQILGDPNKLRGNDPCWTSIPSHPSHFMLQKPRISSSSYEPVSSKASFS